MKVLRAAIGTSILAAVALAVPAARAGPLSFADCGAVAPCPYVAYGDARSYNLMVNATLWDAAHGGGTGPGTPFYVASSPGAIQDLIVVYTGASGQQVNTNFPGMDNAFPAPSGNPTAFYTTTTAADPAPTGPWDQVGTWDTSVTALNAFLSGQSPIFFFNNNQTNSGSAADQNLAAWAEVCLTGTAGQTCFDFNNGPDFTLGPYGDSNVHFFGGGILNGPTGIGHPNTTTPIAGTNLATSYVRAGGELCADALFQPVPCSGPHVYDLNANLGQNQAAYAVVIPQLNNLLANNLGYDAMHIALYLGCDPGTLVPATNCIGRSLTNGPEQLFIGTGTSVINVNRAPEPASLGLLGLGLAALSFSFMRRRKAS